MPKVLSLAWETILEIEHALEDKHCQPEDILELFRRLHNDVQNIHEELAVYINTLSWDRLTICYNDNDDEDCTIAITPILSTEELDNSLSMGGDIRRSRTGTKLLANLCANLGKQCLQGVLNGRRKVGVGAEKESVSITGAARSYPGRFPNEA
nr:hypothetical protein [Tanacetum cinerariifolium]